MSYYSKGILKRRYFLLEASLVMGVIFTGLAITNVLPYQYAAPFEWLGVFFLMSGLTYLYSPWKTVPLAFFAFLIGTFLDPIIIGGRSYETSFYANGLVFAFALAGSFIIPLSRFAAIREI